MGHGFQSYVELSQGVTTILEMLRALKMEI